MGWGGVGWGGVGMGNQEVPPPNWSGPVNHKPNVLKFWTHVDHNQKLNSNNN